MKVAVAARPVEQFDTAVTLPQWQLEPDDEAYYGQPDQDVPTVDADGNPVIPSHGADGDVGQADDSGSAPPMAPSPVRRPRSDDDDWRGPPPPPVPQASDQQDGQAQRLDQHWLDGVLGRKNPPQRNNGTSGY
jgi:penicillin-binding protein 1A